MTLAELRRGALLRYGLNPYEGEDAVLLLPLVNDLVNEAHRWAAREAKLYRRTFTVNLPAASAGVSTVSLNESIIEVDQTYRGVHALDGSTWRELAYRPEAELVDLYGPLPNAGTGTPHSYFFTTGYQDSLQRQLIVYPGPAAEVTNGLQYPAWVYPDAMTAETDRPELPVGEHDLLLPIICWKIAEVLANRGEAAPVAWWLQAAEEAKTDLKQRMERFRRGGGPRRIRVDHAADVY